MIPPVSRLSWCSHRSESIGGWKPTANPSEPVRHAQNGGRGACAPRFVDALAFPADGHPESEKVFDDGDRYIEAIVMVSVTFGIGVVDMLFQVTVTPRVMVIDVLLHVAVAFRVMMDVLFHYAFVVIASFVVTTPMPIPVATTVPAVMAIPMRVPFSLVPSVVVSRRNPLLVMVPLVMPVPSVAPVTIRPGVAPHCQRQSYQRHPNDHESAHHFDLLSSMVRDHSHTASLTHMTRPATKKSTPVRGTSIHK